MFGIGMPEMLMILAVALVVIGPKKLPDLAKSVGRALGEFKRATSDLKESIQNETGLDEVRDSLKEVKSDVRSVLTLDDEVPVPSPIESYSGDGGETDTAADISDTPDEVSDRITPAHDNSDQQTDQVQAEPERNDVPVETPPKSQDAPSDG